MSSEIAKKRRIEDFVEPATSVDLCLKLLKGQQDCDVVFVVGRERMRIGAHMIILKARSTYFEALLSERWASRATTEVHEILLEDYETTTVRLFLSHIYAYGIPASPVEALQLLSLADYYDVKSLVKACEELLAKPFQPDDLLQVFATAKKLNKSDVMAKAGKTMADYFTQLSNSPTFENADEATLMFLLERDDLNVEESDLFASLIRWADKQIRDSGVDLKLNSGRSYFLKNLIPLVRFPTMSIRKFTEVVALSNILPAETERDLFLYFNLHNKDEGRARRAVAERFPFSTVPRMRDLVSIEFYQQESAPGSEAYPTVALTKRSKVIDTLKLKFRRASGTPQSKLQVVSLVLGRAKTDKPRFGFEAILLPIRVAISLSEANPGDNAQLNGTSEEVITTIGDSQIILPLDRPWIISVDKLYKITTRFLADVLTAPAVVRADNPENPLRSRDENYDFFTSTKIRDDFFVHRKSFVFTALSMSGGSGSVVDASPAQGTSLSSGLHLIRSIQVTDI